MPLYTADVLCATAFGKDLGMLETRNTGLVQDVKKLGWRCGNVVDHQHQTMGTASHTENGFWLLAKSEPGIGTGTRHSSIDSYSRSRALRATHWISKLCHFSFYLVYCCLQMWSRECRIWGTCWVHLAFEHSCRFHTGKSRFLAGPVFLWIGPGLGIPDARCASFFTAPKPL